MTDTERGFCHLAGLTTVPLYKDFKTLAQLLKDIPRTNFNLSFDLDPFKLKYLFDDYTQSALFFVQYSLFPKSKSMIKVY